MIDLVAFKSDLNVPKSYNLDELFQLFVVWIWKKKKF